MNKARLRVCSYNIHKGFSTSNLRFLLEEIRHAIHIVNADMVLLQEVVGENIKSRRGNIVWKPATQFEYLAGDIWPHHAYGKNAIYEHGHHGNAILSKEPFAQWSNHDISLLKFSQRGLLFGELGNGVNVVCVHMGLMAFERRHQVNQLIHLIQHYVGDYSPLVIAGDFNDWHRKTHTVLTQTLGLHEACLYKHGKLARTFPSRLPLLAMDRIYFRNLHLIEAECLSGDPWGKLSDHCAMFAEFEL